MTVEIDIPVPGTQCITINTNTGNINEVDIITQLINERELEDHDNGMGSNKQIRNIHLLLPLKDMIIQTRDKTKWCSLMESDHDEKDNLNWDAMRRLIALIIIGITLEKMNDIDDSMVVALLVNHVKHNFRYSFQSPTSGLCHLERPEWAINYIKDVVTRYHCIFKIMKQEINGNVEQVFNAFVPHSIFTMNREKLLEGFKRIAAEFSFSSLVRKWMMVIANEARLFVFSRLPLLFYDYRVTPFDGILTMKQVTNIASKANEQTKVNVTPSLFDDETRVNVTYNLLRAMTELATPLRSIDQAAAYEVFADFDQNVTVPCLNVGFNTEENVALMELDYERKGLCGALDGLMNMERITANRYIKKMLTDDVILETVKCNKLTQHRWYLQDSRYLIQPIETLITLLKIFDERCKCMESTQSKSKFTNTVIAPIINTYIEDVKRRWNAEDNALKSCSLTAFLIDATATLHEFLIRYPYTQYMMQSQANVEKVLNKMISIIGDYVDNLMEQPFSVLHDKRIDIMDALKDKFIQLAVQCSEDIYGKILKATLDCIGKRLLWTLIPERVNQIKLHQQRQLDIALENW
uniref:Uncharacterized protein n=1 Tax=Babesia bovis TaxID=5865 RepID=A7AWM1_BABBO|eukprot:XP_001609017.1 hypothetical protein [Babesia bovis T2Bo]